MMALRGITTGDTAGRTMSLGASWTGLGQNLVNAKL
jgi:hypothetical protein